MEHPERYQGLKFFKPLSRLLGELRERHAHPNRTLHYDEYLILLLLAYYNPVLQSLRGLRKAAGLPWTERNLGLHRTSLGSLSEASHVFDPDGLRRIFLELAGQAQALDAPPRPQGLPEDLRLLAADASLWKLLPRMARALYVGPLTRARKGALKGHFVFDVLRGVPVDAAFTEGATDERHVLPKQLLAGAFYLLDRGYFSFSVLQAFRDAQASFLMRLREGPCVSVVETRARSEAARGAGVVSDEIVDLGKDPARRQRVRVVRARHRAPAPRNLHPQRKRGKHAAYAHEPLDQEWVLVTDRFDLDAELLVALYAYRWQIETFFRWFKNTLKCRHLLAESENGLALQFYAALIATLLVVVHTGRKPTKGLLTTLHLYLMGWAEWRDVEEELQRCKSARP